MIYAITDGEYDNYQLVAMVDDCEKNTPPLSLHDAFIEEGNEDTNENFVDWLVSNKGFRKLGYEEQYLYNAPTYVQAREEANRIAWEKMHCQRCKKQRRVEYGTQCFPDPTVYCECQQSTIGGGAA